MPCTAIGRVLFSRYYGRRTLYLMITGVLAFIGVVVVVRHELVPESISRTITYQLDVIRDNPSQIFSKINSDVCAPAELRPKGSLPLVALNSYPGSGNTWVRQLIEQVTGIVTGSIYCDEDLLARGMKGECLDITCGCTIVTKVHRMPKGLYHLPWKRAILVMRNPYNALMAEWNRRNSAGHVGHANETDFMGKEWTGFIETNRKAWLGLHLVAYRKLYDDILVIHFEDLVADLETQLHRILVFFGMDPDRLRSRLHCTLANSRGKFKRKGTELTFDPFTKEMRANIDRSIRFMMIKLRQNGGPLPPYAAEYL